MGEPNVGRSFEHAAHTATRVFEHVARRDPSVVDLFADDATLVDLRGGRFTGRNEIAEFYRAVFARDAPRPMVVGRWGTPEHVVVLVRADLADGSTIVSLDEVDLDASGRITQLLVLGGGLVDGVDLVVAPDSVVSS